MRWPKGKRSRSAKVSSISGCTILAKTKSKSGICSSRGSIITLNLSGQDSYWSFFFSPSKATANASTDMPESRLPCSSNSAEASWSRANLANLNKPLPFLNYHHFGHFLPALSPCEVSPRPLTRPRPFAVAASNYDPVSACNRSVLAWVCLSLVPVSSSLFNYGKRVLFVTGQGFASTFEQIQNVASCVCLLFFGRGLPFTVKRCRLRFQAGTEIQSSGLVCCNFFNKSKRLVLIQQFILYLAGIRRGRNDAVA